MGKLMFYAMDSPLGEIRILVKDDMPLGISLTGHKAVKAAKGGQPARRISQLLLAIERYFQGKAIHNAFAESVLDNYVEQPPFAEAVLREVIHIPRGEILSYGEVAAMAGKPGAARAVGNIMSSNPFPIIIPCHRVIKSDGTPGGYGGHPNMKIWLLGFEGAPITFR
jgi:O-6-methylguanine DNA methyltransferase